MISPGWLLLPTAIVIGEPLTIGSTAELTVKSPSPLVTLYSKLPPVEDNVVPFRWNSKVASFLIYNPYQNSLFLP